MSQMKEVLSILQFYAEGRHIRSVSWFPTATYVSRCEELEKSGYKFRESNKYNCSSLWVEDGTLAKQFLDNL